MPGLKVLVRDDASLQLGTEPPHALVLRGATPAHAGLLRELDGRHDHPALTSRAERAGLSTTQLDDLLTLLADRGLLVAVAPGDRAPVADADEAARLSPDLTAIALRQVGSARDPWASAHVIAARRGAAWVEVHGGGRVGSGVATLLAAAGVGRVSVVDTAVVGPGDVGPLGFPRAAVGTSRPLAIRDRVGAVSTARSAAHPTPSRTPDLCVLAPDGGPSASLATAWSRRDDPHLLVYVRETAGVVGPLVLPGRTACLRCLDLHRRDVDPAWPREAAQLGDGLARQACDVSLATLVAAQASIEALELLDGGTPRALSATLETRGGTTVRRRAWGPHVDCGCCWTTPEEVPAGAAVRRRTEHAGSATMAG